MKLPLLAILALLAPVAVHADSCGGPPDLDLIGEMAAGRIEQDRKLYLQPSDFFRLQPQIRKELGDRITLCPNIPLKNGKPVIKPKMDFADIWEPMEIAIAAGDWETAEFIAKNVTAKPLPPEALFSLLVFPTFDEKTMLKLRNLLGVTMKDANLGYRYFLLDIFFTLGGRATEPEGIYWVRNDEQLAEARSAAEARKQNIKFVPYSAMHAQQAQQSLFRCGVLSVNADYYINN